MRPLLIRTVIALRVAPIGDALGAWLGPSGNPVAFALHPYPVALVPDGSGGLLVAYPGHAGTGRRRDSIAARARRWQRGARLARGGRGGLLARHHGAARLHARRERGTGGLYLVSIENLDALGSGPAYTQRMLASGQRAAGWPARGRSLANGGAQYSMSLQPDGTGGMIAGWRDSRGATGTDVRSMHVRADGTNQPFFPLNGVVCSTAPPAGATMEAPAMRPDGNAGFWVTYALLSHDTTSTPSSVRLQHSTALGGPDAA